MTDIKRKPKEYYQRAFPEPFNNIPPAVTEKKPGQLSEVQIRQFFSEVCMKHIKCITSTCIINFMQVHEYINIDFNLFS